MPKISKIELRKAIINFARVYNKEESYIKLLEVYTGFPKIVEMISFEMFLQKFDFRSCNEELYVSYMIIYSFARELSSSFAHIISRDHEAIFCFKHNSKSLSDTSFPRPST